MPPITFLTIDDFCLMCLKELYKTSESPGEPSKVYDVSTEINLKKWLNFTTDWNGYSSQKDVLFEHARKICHNCYQKAKRFYEYRGKVFCATKALRLLFDDDLTPIMVRNLQFFCRTCLQEFRNDNDAINTNENKDVKSWLKLCLRFDDNGTMEKSYPKSLCRSCHEELREFVKFRKLTNQSYEQLSSLSSNEEKNRAMSNAVKAQESHKAIKELKVNVGQADEKPKKSGEVKPRATKKFFTKCSKCGETFTKQKLYVDHVAIMHKDMIKPFMCKSCGQSYRMNCSLLRHMRETHGAASKSVGGGSNPSTLLQRYTCEHCARGFKRREHLQLHVSSVHLNLRPFKCSQCDSAFGARKTLRLHEMKHSNDERKKPGVKRKPSRNGQFIL